MSVHPLTGEIYYYGSTLNYPEEERSLWKFDISDPTDATLIATWTKADDMMAGITFGPCDGSEEPVLYGISGNIGNYSRATIYEMDYTNSPGTLTAHISNYISGKIEDYGTGRCIAYSPFDGYLYVIASDYTWYYVQQIDPHTGASQTTAQFLQSDTFGFWQGLLFVLYCVAFVFAFCCFYFVTLHFIMYH